MFDQNTHDEKFLAAVEQQLIGAMLAFPDGMTLLDTSEDSIRHPAHKIIYRQILKQYSEGKNYTPHGIAAEIRTDLERQDALKIKFTDGGTVGIREYCLELACAALTPMSIPDQCRILNEALKRDRIAAVAREALAKHHAGASAADIHAMLVQALSQSGETEKLKTQIDVYREIVENMTKPRACYSTGMVGLDEIMGGGFYAGYTYGFCGAEKAGKTTLAHTISYQLDTPHLYVAMEMGANQIEQRNYARDLGINSLQFLKNRNVNPQDISAILPTRKTCYLDAVGQSLDEILYQVGIAKMRFGITGFILDYWQLIGGHDGRTTEEKHLRDCAQGAANFARKQGLWCMMLAQMNKDGQLFGGNGLRKACDMLLMIEQHDPEVSTFGRWIRMDASRYTVKQDFGSDQLPAMFLNNQTGPFFQEIEGL